MLFKTIMNNVVVIQSFLLRTCEKFFDGLVYIHFQRKLFWKKK